jgi:DNA-binding MarR family transcriptional regulator
VDMSPRKPREDAGLRAWLNLVQTQSMVVDAVSTDLEREAGLPLPWFEVLLQVTNGPDGLLTMQELAHSVLLSKSGVTRLVDRMVEAGLIERRACATDRRVVYASATAEGRAALRKALPVHAESLDRHFSTILTAAEQTALSTTLRKVLDAAGFAPTPCPTGLPAETRRAPADAAPTRPARTA